jgi:G:T-mismatch repair DNA endonuclease (very short patch repair protein)
MIHGIPYSEKWKKDALKKKTFEELGYKVVTMWESDYYKFKKELNRNIRENV